MSTNDEWMRDAACREAGITGREPADLWFPEQSEKAPDAKRYCAVCSVRRQCLEYALGLPYETVGIFGGTDSGRRRVLRHRRRKEAA